MVFHNFSLVILPRIFFVNSNLNISRNTQDSRGIMSISLKETTGGSRQIHPKTRSYRLQDRFIRNIEREYLRPSLISSGWLMEVAALRCDEGEIASTSHKTDRERGIVYRKSRIDTSMPQIEASGNNTARGSYRRTRL